MKKVFAFLLMFTIALSLAFAQGKTEKPVDIVVNEEFIGNKNADTIITVALNKDETVASLDKKFSDHAYEVQMEWAKNHPQWGIELQTINVLDISVDMAKFLTDAEMGVAPDVIKLDSYYVGPFKDAGVLQPLNDVIPQEELDQFFDWTKEVTVDNNGNQIALWGETDARILFYRNDLIKDPPRTWDELIDTAVKLHNETGMNGYLIPLGMGEACSSEGTWPFFWGMGGEIFDKEGKPVLGTGENRQKLIDVYTFDKRLVDSGASPIDIQSMIGFVPVYAEVAAGNVAMFLGGTWMVEQLKDLVADPSVWSYTFLPMKEADQYSTSCGGWTWGILTKDHAKKEVAASFLMDTICGKKGMEKRCLAQGQIPVRKDVFELESFQANKNMVNFYEQFKIGHTRPAFSMYPFISDINSRMVGKVLMGELTPEQAVDELQKICEDEWNKNYKKP